MGRWLTVPEAAGELNLGLTVTWTLVSTGKLKSVTIGRSRRVPEEAIAEFKAAKAREAGLEPAIAV